MTRLLVVDDDPNVRDLLRLALGREGFEVAEAKDGEEALDVLDAQSVDLAVVDVMMPRLDGISLCRAIRGAGDLPILMLTARTTTRDKVAGLQEGADDYLTKPFDPPELLARIRALLRRSGIAHSKELRVGRLTLDATTFEARSDGGAHHLPRKEFELLFELGSKSGQTLTREHLVAKIWGYDYPGDERTVDVHVKRLRDRLSEEDAGFRIRTIRGLGYRLEELS